MFRLFRGMPARQVTVGIVAWGWLLSMDGRTDEISYLRDIQPLLEERCYRCHGAEKERGGLRLDVRAFALKGGESGEKGVVPGHSGRSRLFQLVSSEDDDERMPPSKAKEAALSEGELDRMKRWIDAGAEWPDASADEEPPRARSEMRVTEGDRQHWSFVSLRSVVPPSVDDVAWLRSSVDAFIRDSQEEKSVNPSPQADASKLVRRIFFNLIGLPPSPEEMTFWSERIERSREEVGVMVDTLLDSPHYGERWARHWLDVARTRTVTGWRLMRIDPMPIAIGIS
jgi:hypothetical protein